MPMRFILALCALVAATIPALAEPPKPTVVVTVKPVSQLLIDYRDMLHHIGGQVQGDQLVKEFDNDLKEVLGEHGFEGVDINRPLAAYTIVREKFDETNVVLVLPITGEKEFLSLLERLKFKTEPVKDKKGLYKLIVAEPGILLRNDSHVQFMDGGWAYVGINGDEVADEKTRVSLADLIENADPSLFSVKLFPGRFPEKLLKGWLEEMETTAKALKGFAVRGGGQNSSVRLLQTFFEEGPKLVRRYAETGLKDVAEVRIQFNWESTTGDAQIDLSVTPNGGTALAKEVAARVPTVNRFAGMVPANAAVGVVGQAPLFAKELREIIGVAFDAAGEEVATAAKSSGISDPFLPVTEEFTKGIVQTVKKGELDMALALIGPDKSAKFTIVGGVSFVDATEIEKKVRQAAKAPELAKVIELDVAKVGGVSIHKVPGPRRGDEDIDRELNKLIGENAPAYMAFAKDAAFFSVGPEGLAAIKAAIEAKPGPAPVVELTGNMNRLQKVIALMVGNQEAGMFAKFIGTDDKTVRLLRVTVEGGQTLKVKTTVNLHYLPRFILLGEHVMK